MHGKEKHIFADSGYRGAHKREELQGTTVEWYIAEQQSKVKKFKEHPRINKVAIKNEYLKASVRAFVEHPFRIIKCQFAFRKTRYRGIAKNDNKIVPPKNWNMVTSRLIWPQLNGVRLKITATLAIKVRH